MRVCTIDIGTISVRALVADVDEGGGIRVVAREGHITRLGEGLSERGLLGAAAMERTARTVGEIVEKARRLGAGQFKLVATSAARSSANADELTDRIRGLTSLEVNVITGLEEAKYICEGALRSLAIGEKPVLLADIGGGSTEMIFARRDENPVLCSVATGAVYLTERFLRHDPPQADAVSSAFEDALAMLENAHAGLPRGAEELIGLGGTITTVPPIVMGMRKYDASRVHNSVVGVGQVLSVLRRLVSMSLPERRRVRGLEPGRADIIVGGLLILKALLKASGFEKVRVSDRGILFGLALSMPFVRG
jgi:exopolyphosphatase/guanosine-5'-triphosphate,3'-diphosphate pyrophosphatase